MKKRLYRFRPIERLLDGNNELKDQSIFFADSVNLNDPMEGFRDIYWSGDKIAWKNLLKHYLFCLNECLFSAIVGGDQYILSDNDLPIYSSENDIQTDELKKLFNKIKFSFFEVDAINQLIEELSIRTSNVRKNELSAYLNVVHSYALKVICNCYIDNGIFEESDSFHFDLDKPLYDIFKKEFFTIINDLSTISTHDKIMSIFTAHTHIRNVMLLSKELHTNHVTKNPNRGFLEIYFPDLYLDLIGNLLYPHWYTACFMSDYKNSSVWGNYAGNHEGVCLIFTPKLINSRGFLKLNGINGFTASQTNLKETYGEINLEFHKVDYVKGVNEIDFFRNLGRLNQSTIESMWHCDEGGNYSNCSSLKDFKTIDEWRQDYWKKFYVDLTKKSKDWEYEKEYRLIHHSSTNDLTIPEKRILNYDFESLEGLIFGINTSLENKIKIIKIIKDKCITFNRRDFKFYQAYYSHETKNIQKGVVDIFQF